MHVLLLHLLCTNPLCSPQTARFHLCMFFCYTYSARILSVHLRPPDSIYSCSIAVPILCTNPLCSHQTARFHLCMFYCYTYSARILSVHIRPPDSIYACSIATPTLHESSLFTSDRPIPFMYILLLYLLCTNPLCSPQTARFHLCMFYCYTYSARILSVHLRPPDSIYACSIATPTLHESSLFTSDRPIPSMHVLLLHLLCTNPLCSPQTARFHLCMFYCYTFSARILSVHLRPPDSIYACSIATPSLHVSSLFTSDRPIPYMHVLLLYLYSARILSVHLRPPDSIYACSIATPTLHESSLFTSDRPIPSMHVLLLHLLCTNPLCSPQTARFYICMFYCCIYSAQILSVHLRPPDSIYVCSIATHTLHESSLFTPDRPIPSMHVLLLYLYSARILSVHLRPPDSIYVCSIATPTLHESSLFTSDRPIPSMHVLLLYLYSARILSVHLRPPDSIYACSIAAPTLHESSLFTSDRPIPSMHVLLLHLLCTNPLCSPQTARFHLCMFYCYTFSARILSVHLRPPDSIYACSIAVPILRTNPLCSPQTARFHLCMFYCYTYSARILSVHLRPPDSIYVCSIATHTLHESSLFTPDRPIPSMHVLLLYLYSARILSVHLRPPDSIYVCSIATPTLHESSLFTSDRPIPSMHVLLLYLYSARILSVHLRPPDSIYACSIAAPTLHESSLFTSDRPIPSMHVLLLHLLCTNPLCSPQTARFHLCMFYCYTFSARILSVHLRPPDSIYACSIAVPILRTNPLCSPQTARFHLCMFYCYTYSARILSVHLRPPDSIYACFIAAPTLHESSLFTSDRPILYMHVLLLHLLCTIPLCSPQTARFHLCMFYCYTYSARILSVHPRPPDSIYACSIAVPILCPNPICSPQTARFHLCMFYCYTYSARILSIHLRPPDSIYACSIAVPVLCTNPLCSPQTARFHLCMFYCCTYSARILSVHLRPPDSIYACSIAVPILCMNPLCSPQTARFHLCMFYCCTYSARILSVHIRPPDSIYACSIATPTLHESSLFTSDRPIPSMHVLLLHLLCTNPLCSHQTARFNLCIFYCCTYSARILSVHLRPPDSIYACYIATPTLHESSLFTSDRPIPSMHVLLLQLLCTNPLCSPQTARFHLCMFYCCTYSARILSVHLRPPDSIYACSIATPTLHESSLFTSDRPIPSMHVLLLHLLRTNPLCSPQTARFYIYACSIAAPTLHKSSLFTSDRPIPSMYVLLPHLLCTNPLCSPQTARFHLCMFYCYTYSARILSIHLRPPDSIYACSIAVPVLCTNPLCSPQTARFHLCMFYCCTCTLHESSLFTSDRPIPSMHVLLLHLLCTNTLCSHQTARFHLCMFYCYTYSARILSVHIRPPDSIYACSIAAPTLHESSLFTSDRPIPSMHVLLLHLLCTNPLCSHQTARFHLCMFYCYTYSARIHSVHIRPPDSIYVYSIAVPTLHESSLFTSDRPIPSMHVILLHLLCTNPLCSPQTARFHLCMFYCYNYSARILSVHLRPPDSIYACSTAAPTLHESSLFTSDRPIPSMHVLLLHLLCTNPLCSPQTARFHLCMFYCCTYSARILSVHLRPPDSIYMHVLLLHLLCTNPLCSPQIARFHLCMFYCHTYSARILSVHPRPPDSIYVCSIATPTLQESSLFTSDRPIPSMHVLLLYLYSARILSVHLRPPDSIYACSIAVPVLCTNPLCSPQTARFHLCMFYCCTYSARILSVHIRPPDSIYACSIATPTLHESSLFTSDRPIPSMDVVLLHLLCTNPLCSHQTARFHLCICSIAVPTLHESSLFTSDRPIPSMHVILLHLLCTIPLCSPQTARFHLCMFYCYTYSARILSVHLRRPDSIYACSIAAPTLHESSLFTSDRPIPYMHVLLLYLYSARILSVHLRTPDSIYTCSIATPTLHESSLFTSDRPIPSMHVLLLHLLCTNPLCSPQTARFHLCLFYCCTYSARILSVHLRPPDSIYACSIATPTLHESSLFTSDRPIPYMHVLLLYLYSERILSVHLRPPDSIYACSIATPTLHESSLFTSDRPIPSMHVLLLHLLCTNPLCSPQTARFYICMFYCCTYSAQILSVHLRPPDSIYVCSIATPTLHESSLFTPDRPIPSMHVLLLYLYSARILSVHLRPPDSIYVCSIATPTLPESSLFTSDRPIPSMHVLLLYLYSARILSVHLRPPDSIYACSIAAPTLHESSLFTSDRPIPSMHVLLLHLLCTNPLCSHQTARFHLWMLYCYTYSARILSVHIRPPDSIYVCSIAVPTLHESSLFTSDRPIPSMHVILLHLLCTNPLCSPQTARFHLCMFYCYTYSARILSVHLRPPDSIYACSIAAPTLHESSLFTSDRPIPYMHVLLLYLYSARILSVHLRPPDSIYACSIATPTLHESSLFTSDRPIPFMHVLLLHLLCTNPLCSPQTARFHICMFYCYTYSARILSVHLRSPDSIYACYIATPTIHESSLFTSDRPIPCMHVLLLYLLCARILSVHLRPPDSIDACSIAEPTLHESSLFTSDCPIPSMHVPLLHLLFTNPLCSPQTARFHLCMFYCCTYSARILSVHLRPPDFIYACYIAAPTLHESSLFTSDRPIPSMHVLLLHLLCTNPLCSPQTARFHLYMFYCCTYSARIVSVHLRPPDSIYACSIATSTLHESSLFTSDRPIPYMHVLLLHLLCTNLLCSPQTARFHLCVFYCYTYSARIFSVHLRPPDSIYACSIATPTLHESSLFTSDRPIPYMHVLLLHPLCTNLLCSPQTARFHLCMFYCYTYSSRILSVHLRPPDSIYACSIATPTLHESSLFTSDRPIPSMRVLLLHLLCTNPLCSPQTARFHLCMLYCCTYSARILSVHLRPPDSIYACSIAVPTLHESSLFTSDRPIPSMHVLLLHLFFSIPLCSPQTARFHLCMFYCYTYSSRILSVHLRPPDSIYACSIAVPILCTNPLCSPQTARFHLCMFYCYTCSARSLSVHLRPSDSIYACSIATPSLHESSLFTSDRPIPSMLVLLLHLLCTNPLCSPQTARFHLCMFYCLLCTMTLKN